MNVYLIASNSYRLLQEKLGEILSDNPYTSFDLLYDSLEDVLEEALYFSFFEEKKYIVVRNAFLFGSAKKKTEEKKDTKNEEKLLQYLKNPNPNTVLIFTLNGKVDGKKKITSAIKEWGEVLSLDDLKPSEIKEKMIAYLKKDGYKIDANSITHIMNHCLNNYDLILNELDKIKLFYGKGCMISFLDVTHIVSRLLEDNYFKFLDAVMNKNVKEALLIYEDLKVQKIEPFVLLVMLSKEIRNTLLVKQLGAKNKKELMATLEMKYDFQIDKLINRSYSFKEEELEDYLLYLASLDYQIKSGKVDKKNAIFLFILYMNK